LRYDFRGDNTQRHFNNKKTICNQITEIKEISFNGLNNLQELDLGYNPITEIKLSFSGLNSFLDSF
jgi:hypothetical protein